MTENSANQRQQYREEQAVVLDYIKHLTSLATGAVVIIPALLEKLFAVPKAKWLVIIAVGAFASAVVALALSALGVVRSLRDAVAGGPSNVSFTSVSFLAGLCLFLIGLSTLTIFAVTNLL
jgi:hypothetical protein